MPSRMSTVKMQLQCHCHEQEACFYLSISCLKYTWRYFIDDTRLFEVCAVNLTIKLGDILLTLKCFVQSVRIFCKVRRTSIRPYPPITPSSTTFGFPFTRCCLIQSIGFSLSFEPTRHIHSRFRRSNARSRTAIW